MTPPQPAPQPCSRRGPPLLRPQFLGAEGTRWVRNGDLPSFAQARTWARDTKPALRPQLWGPSGILFAEHVVSKLHDAEGIPGPSPTFPWMGLRCPSPPATLVSPEGWPHGSPLPRGHRCPQALLPGDLPKPQTSAPALPTSVSLTGSPPGLLGVQTGSSVLPYG